VSDIFNEVDEELRRDRAMELWRRYGKYAVAGALAIVLATSAVVGWREYQTRQRASEGERFAAAVADARAGRSAEAAAAFAALADTAKSGYAALARFREAASLVQSGKIKDAVAAYDRLALDNASDKALRDLARIEAAMLLMETASAEEVMARLKPLAAEGAMRHLARELEAVLLLKSGKTAEVKAALARLADDAEAPAGVRGRAAELLAALGGAG
jgi:hypothetical protein